MSWPHCAMADGDNHCQQQAWYYVHFKCLGPEEHSTTYPMCSPHALLSVATSAICGDCGRHTTAEMRRVS